MHGNYTEFQTGKALGWSESLAMGDVWSRFCIFSTRLSIIATCDGRGVLASVYGATSVVLNWLSRITAFFGHR